MQLLDKRLLAIADQINWGGVVCDVGTDHGYLPAYLLESGKCIYAYACDINVKPLEAAEKTLQKYIKSGKAEVILSDGLKNVPYDKITDIAIAGMGAELISEILMNAEWIKNGVNIVLQPMTRVNYIRRWLCENGFTILSEKAVKDNGHFYVIQKVKYSGECTDCSDIFELIGLASKSDLEGKLYIEMQMNRMNSIADGLKKSKSDLNPTVYSELAERLKKILEE